MCSMNRKTIQNRNTYNNVGTLIYCVAHRKGWFRVQTPHLADKYPCTLLDYKI